MEGDQTGDLRGAERENKLQVCSVWVQQSVLLLSFSSHGNISLTQNHFKGLNVYIITAEAGRVEVQPACFL